MLFFFVTFEGPALINASFLHPELIDEGDSNGAFERFMREARECPEAIFKDMLSSDADGMSRRMHGRFVELDPVAEDV